MNFIDVFLLALALSADAFVVAFSYGLVIKKKKASQRSKSLPQPDWDSLLCRFSAGTAPARFITR